MPLCINKDCFPAPSKCHNCERKRSSHVKKETDPKEDLKRCSSCHLLTYCDKDCQREHWIKVHKSHCRFLSGKVPVKNSKHNPATCPGCIDQNQASPSQLSSEDSPKTVCNIQEVAILMKKSLNQAFRFHGDGKKCNCPLESAGELPFALGEVSGQYVEIGSTGLDAILAHSLKILNAMFIKAKKEEHKNALIQFWKDIMGERSLLWYDILVSGMPRIRPGEQLLRQVDSLQTFYQASNPWWRALKFTVIIISKTNRNLTSIYYDSSSLRDPRFKNFKLILDYRQSQLENRAIMCQKKLWGNLMVWPGMANGSLSMLLPPGTRCQSCYVEMCGEVALSHHEVNFETLPCLLSNVGDNGALMAHCPVAKNPSCRVNCLTKDVEGLFSNEDQWKEFSNETVLFGIESRDCDFCFKSSLSSHRCSSCLTVQYCSTICQKKDLEFHKSVCATWAKDQSRKILGKGKQKDHWKSVLGGQ